MEAIQLAIDTCAKAGGGCVRIPQGVYLCGALRLCSNLELLLEEGAVLKGSDNHLDYGEGKWADAFLVGKDLERLAL